MTIDISKIAEGDEVTLRAFVVDPMPTRFGQIAVRLDVGAVGLTGTRINAEHILTHTPKALCVGDRVRWGTKRDGELIAIHGNQAWVSVVGDGCATFVLTDLERVQ